MNEIEQRLQDLKVSVERGKSDRDKLTGELKGGLDRLKKFDVKSLGAADKLAKNLKRQCNDMEAELEGGVAQLQEQFDW